MLEIDQRPNGVYNVEKDQNESSSGPFFLWEEDCLVCPYLVLSQFRGVMDIKSDQMPQITRLLFVYVITRERPKIYI